MKNRILHKVIASLLTLVLFASVIKSASTLIDFKINQDEIAKTLCVQKEDQQGCNGKCQLVKALKKDITPNTETPLSTSKTKIIIHSYIQPICDFNISFNDETFKITQNFDEINYNIIKKYYKVITPPPLV